MVIAMNIIIDFILFQFHTRVSPSPQKLMIYSDMEADSIIVMVMEAIIDE